MKLRQLSCALAVVAITLLMLTGSIAADPPKEDFYFRWMLPDEALWFSAGGEDFCPVQTGNYWHSACGVWPFYVVDSTHPLISGTYVWKVQTLNGVYVPEWSAFWPPAQIHGTWRIDPVGIDGYWEGTFQTVGNWLGEYEMTISKMVGKGHGALEGLQLKGEHWYDPVEPGTSPYWDMWPVSSGTITITGGAK